MLIPLFCYLDAVEPPLSNTCWMVDLEWEESEYVDFLAYPEHNIFCCEVVGIDWVSGESLLEGGL
jgi:hypothetical protein